MRQYWIAVASREHVLRGAVGGFCQVCHGKPGPLARMNGGDYIAYYSPTEKFGEKIPCRRFTAIGNVVDREPYFFQMSADFTPWRRDVIFLPAMEAPIAPLIDELSFIYDKKRWGFPFKRGCFAVSGADFAVIASRMDVQLDGKI